MFEYDENGEEWIGYSFSSEESDPSVVVNIFLGNIQYLEWLYRQIRTKSKKLTLAEQIHYLFDLLPPDVEPAITDDRPSLSRILCE